MILKKNSFMEVWGQHTICDTFWAAFLGLIFKRCHYYANVSLQSWNFCKSKLKKVFVDTLPLCERGLMDNWDSCPLQNFIRSCKVMFTTSYCHSNVKTTNSASVAVLPSLHCEVWLEVVFPISRLFVQDGRMHLLMPIKPPFLHSRSSWQLSIQLCLRLKTLKRVSGTKPKQAINLKPL